MELYEFWQLSLNELNKTLEILGNEICQRLRFDVLCESDESGEEYYDLELKDIKYYHKENVIYNICGLNENDLKIIYENTDDNSYSKEMRIIKGETLNENTN